MRLFSVFKNASSLDRVQWANYASIGIFIITESWRLIADGFDWIALLGGLNFLFAWLIFINVIRVRRSLNQVAELIDRGAQGELEERIVCFDDRGALRKVVDNLNYFFDEVDAFLREVRTPVQEAARGNFNRPIVATGFTGQFKAAAEDLKAPLEAMKKNQIFIERVKINSDLSRLGGGMQKGLQILQGDLKKSNEKATEIRRASEETARVASQSVDELKRMSGILNELVSSVEASDRVVESLNEQASNINSIVNLIKEIAEQTNLLSLNAAIEAARAGEHGRGFAVVADEVRALANKTQSAADEVTQSIEMLQQQTHQTRERTRVMAEHAATVQDFLRRFEQVLGQVNDNARIASGYAMLIYETVFVALAKLNHIIYKSRGFSSVFNGKAELQTVSHTECAFGRWYHGEGREQFKGHEDLYRRIETPHARFHQTISDALQYVKDDETIIRHKEEILSHFAEAEAVSDELFALLDQLLQVLEREIMQQGGSGGADPQQEA
ncbi:methyl-accepting chemotaxis protein [Sulfurivirga sp.]|uniref:methyl-accepting chemotaxis protein n=1 Tax=Sulfurivirga sp. TaxID=2614236 RepID=UPI0025D0FB8C|nr:methyl-accepting chemotaxis protein [Sulfurivirga sp.]